MDLCAIFQDFLKTVETRIGDANRSGDPITEDTLCSYLAGSFMVSGHVACHLIELEIPHPAFKKEKGMQKACDLRVFDGPASIWIEVKFDREPPSGAAMNKTNRLGKLVNDMMRTASIPNGEKFFVYITTATMLDHIARNYRTFLGNESFAIDRQWVEGLPQSARSQVKDYVLTEIGTRKVMAQPLCQENRGNLTCILYRVTRN